MELKHKLIEDAKKYKLELQKKYAKNSVLKFPLIYLIVGDKAAPILEDLKRNIDNQVLDADNAMYIVIDTLEEGTVEVEENIINLHLPESVIKNEREYIRSAFKQNKSITLLNKAVKEIQRLAIDAKEFYSDNRRVYLSVVTSAEDKLNAIIPDVTVFIKNKLAGEFKQVFSELFIFTNDYAEKDNMLNMANSYKFLKEAMNYQENTYRYQDALEVIEQDVRLETNYTGAIFYFTYVLGDRDENGNEILNLKDNRAETLANVNLIKNTKSDIYNEGEVVQFSINEFARGADSRKKFCSVSSSSVEVPSEKIYLAAVSKTLEYYMKVSELEDDKDDDEFNNIINEEFISRAARSCIPNVDNLKEIGSVLSHKVSYLKLKNMSINDAEKALYDDALKNFFDKNFRNNASAKLKNYMDNVEIFMQLEDKNVNSKWTQRLVELEQKYNETINEKISVLKDKKFTKVTNVAKEKIAIGSSKNAIIKIKDYLLQEVYQIEYELLEEELKKECIYLIKTKILDSMHGLNEKINKLGVIKSQIDELLIPTSYLTDNMQKFYGDKVADITKDYERKLGKKFILSNEYIGNINQLVNNDNNKIVGIIGQVVKEKIINNDKYFKTNLGEEMYERLNYLPGIQREHVTYEEIFLGLSDILERRALTSVYFNKKDKCYKEKYYVTNLESDFLEYVYPKEDMGQIDKLGIQLTNRKDKIKIVQLIGGFDINDLAFTEAAKKYYDSYRENVI